MNLEYFEILQSCWQIESAICIGFIVLYLYVYD